ncbi:hypothetical protein M5689_020788 [Euphorbia peplus]|nr:hypothetical protein M5689_020788 [Euphorbia peplus]
MNFEVADQRQPHEDSISPEREEIKEPPQSTIQNKETTRNLGSDFEEEEDDGDEPTAGDVLNMMRSMQKAQEHQAVQHQFLINQQLTLKEENKNIMKLIYEQILKPSGTIPGSPGENETIGDQDAGHYASPHNLTPRRSPHVITSPRQQIPHSEAELEIQFERWMEKHSIGGVIGACVASSSTLLTQRVMKTAFPPG